MLEVLSFIILSFLLLVFFICMASINSPLSSLTILWKQFLPYLATLLGVSKFRPVTAFLAPFLFFGMLSLLVGGFLPYGGSFIVSMHVVFFLCFSCWLTAFLYRISTEGFSSLMVKKGHSFFFNFFMAPIEFVSEFIKPFSLFVRLYANIMFGHFMLKYAYLLLWSFGPLFYWLAAPLFVFELAVYLVQSYIFTYLVLMYFSE